MAGLSGTGAMKPTRSSRIMGLDEAGRGSLLGPLVVGGFVTSAGTIPRLRDLGVRDSKRLSAARREELARELGSMGDCLVRRIPPATIDRWVARGGLNRLEARTFGRLVRFAGPDWAYVDACDPRAHRFGQHVLQSARTPTVVIAQHHADRDLPVVAAASIIAKVERDRCIGRLERMLGEPVGSGYPSDRRTTRLVEDVWAREGSLPPWVRRSWATTERLKLSSGAPRPEAFP